MDGRAQELSTMTTKNSIGRRFRFGRAISTATLALGLGWSSRSSRSRRRARSFPHRAATMKTSAAATAQLVAQLAAGPDPLARFRDLSPADRQARLRYLSVVSVTTTPLARQSADLGTALLAAAPGAGCWVWKWERDAYNAFGLKLWAYFQEIDWCDDGYRMTGSPQVLNFG
jgi:hypothetical protein